MGASAVRACISAGAKVVATGRDAAKLEAIESEFDANQVKVTHGDATDSTSCEKAIQLANDSFGKVHGLYHVAGGSGRKFGDGPLDEMSDEGIDFVLNLNLKSVLYSNRAAVQYFLKQGIAGSVVNMGSVLGRYPSTPNFTTHTYATTKAAIEGLSKSAAAHYAKHSIRFNVIAPALVDTPMAGRAATNDQIMSYIKTKQPLDGGRIGMPQDTDAAVVFLLSDHASFITGQTLYVDGGWSVSEGQLA